MAGKSYEALNYRKTPRGQRGTYTYEFADGEKITVIPGAEGCTEIDIRRLHSIDDHEVYVNIKVSGCLSGFGGAYHPGSDQEDPADRYLLSMRYICGKDWEESKRQLIGVYE